MTRAGEYERAATSAYNRASEVGANLTTFACPVDAAPGSYASVGPGAPAGCNPLACEDEPNDGTQRWIGDVPHTIPGIVGAEKRLSSPRAN